MNVKSDACVGVQCIRSAEFEVQLKPIGYNIIKDMCSNIQLNTLRLRHFYQMIFIPKQRHQLNVV